ncbi:Uma2 family endonuclease [Prochlorothrix hollandica]|uniref:Putative restriction endonuclease domain-containing protein n=1 Tax=Prochlorothrix hollandica PCC 9006 = CALU 1027 TaxID=317619 RepID=A0A0M2PS56_PROHO|nr:Uma2 family endonuclease [Prochlorothrix hollandica]KKI98964.1 hypothetical protein PROH_14155 [Prochlorothrix hollandica PCC 9006 = CALU 1027]
MNWQEVCEHPQLQNLPFKVELNRWGQVVMSPVKVKHSFFQGRIQRVLETFLKTGEVMPECAIATTDGVKVADVVWCSSDRFAQIEAEVAASIAPEICIEVTSAGNTEEEMLGKRQLYLAAGALEVWVCDDQARVTFYDRSGALTRSGLVPDFPHQIQR